MERVSQSTVIRHWLRLEAEERGGEPIDVEALDEAEVLDRLLQTKPGAAAFIWRDAPIIWYRHELSREEFLALHVVSGPQELSWRALSPDNTIRSVGERFAEEAVDTPTDVMGVDVPKIIALRDEMPGAAEGMLVVSTRRGCVPWTIADGNHRAVAKAAYLHGGGTYEPQEAYLGVGANPVVDPLRERVCGGLRRLFRPTSGRVVRP